ncbi:MAG: N-acetylmuramoyl-L-alanine amidase [Eubacteriales bacterium]|nr:N-acetylmuramoyl-L-alanine amidase [Eubacteriales bacterium]
MFLYIFISNIVLAWMINYGEQHYPKGYAVTEEIVTEEKKDDPKPEEALSTEAASTEEASTEAVVDAKTYRIVLDPGHGGNDSGVEYRSDHGKVSESKINFIIASYLKKYLEEYDNVEVLMTRNKDKWMYLDERVEFAAEHDADFLISLHNNSMEDAGGYAAGCSVCVALGNYQEKIGKASQLIGVNIAHELEELGLKNNGLVMKASKDNDYDNGRAADYFAIIRGAMEESISAVIVEHGFLDNPDDFYDFLSTKAQLKKIALADCRGIARYLQLQKSDTKEVLPELSNYKIKISHTKRSGYTRRFSKVFYH